MFQQVQGVNGRAACQDDWTTFLIMRLSQFEGWDTDVLESYFEDIVQAEAQERNLIMEKYAYMMEETDPYISYQLRNCFRRFRKKNS